MKGILAFGDSIIKGISLQNGRYRATPKRFTMILEEYLNIPIKNNGQMGSTVMRLEKAMGRALQMLQSPEYDTVFLSYGGNDSDYDWQAISDDPDGSHFCRTRKQRFVEEYQKGIEYLKSMGKKVFLLSLPPVDADKYFSWISRNRNAEAIKRWLKGDVEHISYWHEMFNLTVFQIGAATGTKVLDISSCFLSRPNYGKLLCEDGAHPNQEGHQLIANALASQLNL